MTQSIDVTLNVNGRDVCVSVEPRRSLADCLRHDLSFTGTHIGCEHGVCGACTVMMDGEAVRSCLILAVQAENRHVETVESLAEDNCLSVVQEEFRTNHALQCGFCTPGILMSAQALLNTEPEASNDRIREVLSGHICRCTGYIPIVTAIANARDRLSAASRDRYAIEE
ncbi:2Fe-2S iron-sulfur cluster-binding protein [Aminobacter aminovorans]|uniref:(2Fe-2S)-binding protein n=1 Tax=Aminobacter aminovorans TaxID=83263 RepID=UPI0028655664|nr:2Fe-2S iron-sulfur cluster-binding protein [Aminobacter aminovorans]MDR7224003.1 carbon-monoxide dehydrogenase small subunit [Aminobacter aminovorans]